MANALATANNERVGWQTCPAGIRRQARQAMCWI